MNDFYNGIQYGISAISNGIWQIFLPILVIAAFLIGYKTLFVIRKKTTVPANMTFRQFVGPTAISMGAMIGTGAILGVLGAINKYVAAGQIYIEAILFWTLIGCVVMLPLSYSETLLSKIVNRVPKEMIAHVWGPKSATVYGFSFVLLYVFGFGGFQFSGISNVLTMMSDYYLKIEIGTMQRYLCIVIPLVIITSTVVLMRKHEVFVNTMAGMIGFAVAMYFIFFVSFIIKTADYIPVFCSRMIMGIKNPLMMASGVPLGMILAFQRIIQTSEIGLGGLSMVAHENNSKPRAAALISVIPVIVTIFVAIAVTTYITSYGIYSGNIVLPADDFTRLNGLFQTIQSVSGNFGLVVLTIFTILSGASTLLGSHYYVKVIFDRNSENKNIAVYVILILAAGTLATFGFSVIFDIIDLLLFLVTFFFVTTLAAFAHKEWKNYIIVDGQKN